MKRKQGNSIWRFGKQRRLLAFMLASALLCSMLTVSGNARISRAESEAQNTGGSHGLSNPVTDSEGITTWDCVYFGNYWQNDTNGDGVADKKDEKEPIKWRVLSVDGDDAFLLADKNLDVQEYNNTGRKVTWETCTVRSWLNGYGAEVNVGGNDYTNDNFLKNAFTDSEQAAIQETNVVNEGSSEYGAEGGNNTTDKVYLLSVDEVTNPVYGFRKTWGGTVTRQVVNTAYVAGGGKRGEEYSHYINRSWLLRSLGILDDFDRTFPIFVLDGQLYPESGVTSMYNSTVRPALHLNLSLVSEWLYAGSVTSGEKWMRVDSSTSDNMAGRVLHNPMIDSDGDTTWDCICFGRYWQYDTNYDGIADKNDEKKPVKWRVLSVDGNDAFLLADNAIDVQRYNEIDEKDVTWETCTMRSWLNDKFLQYAFSESEQAAILNTSVINVDNSEYGTEGGIDTLDKVFLLSVNEVANPTYGFQKIEESSNIRRVVKTLYVQDGGEIGTSRMSGFGNGCSWWLRSPGSSSLHASYVSYDGYVNQNGYDVNGTYMTVRPALHLNLSSVSEWSYAGTVTVFGDKAEVPVPSPEVTATPSLVPAETGEPTVTPSLVPEETEKPSPSMVPTKEPVQSEEPEKPTVTLSPTPEETSKPSPSTIPTKTPTNPVITPGSQLETPVMTATPAVQKPGKVAGLKLIAKKNGIQASWKKCNGAAGYEVWYGTSKKLADKKKKNVKSARITITKLKKKKTYYVKVRAFVNQKGKKVYGAWSSTAKKKVK